MDRDELREKLASLEHGQWAHWTEYIFSHLTPENIQRWKHQLLTSYEFLTEREKDSDREWADKVLSILAPVLADAEKWKRVKGIAEHAKTPTVEGTCDKCGLLYKCHSLRTRASSGALLVPCIELYRYIDALDGKEEG